MLEINKYRIVNLRYSGKLYKDDTFNLKCGHAMNILTNSGGKTVTCKFVLMPYNWGSNKYVKENIINWYNNFDGPTYIMNEYNLDNKKYMMICVGIYKENKDKEENTLSRYAFVTFYNSPNDEYSLKNFKIYQKENELLYKPSDLYNMFLNDNNVRCFSTKASGNNKYKNFITLLNENNIDTKFYSEIAPNIIGGESGIGAVFDAYKNESELIKKVFLPISEKKVFSNGDESQSQILESIARQLVTIANDEKNNADEIEARIVLKDFNENLKELIENVKCLESNEEAIEKEEQKLQYIINKVKELLQTEIEKGEKTNEEISYIKKEIEELNYFYTCAQIKEKIEKKNEEVNKSIEKKDELKNIENQIKEIENTSKEYKFVQYHKEMQKCIESINNLKIRKEPIEKQNEAYAKKIKEYGEKIYSIIKNKIRLNEEDISKLQQDIKNIDVSLSDLIKERDKLKENGTKAECDLKQKEVDKANNVKSIKSTSLKCKEFSIDDSIIGTPFFDTKYDEYIEDYKNKEKESKDELAKCELKTKNIKSSIDFESENINSLEDKVRSNTISKNNKEQEEEYAKDCLSTIEECINRIKKYYTYGDYKKENCDYLKNIKKENIVFLSEIEKEYQETTKKIAQLEKYKGYISQKSTNVDESLIEFLNKNDISFKYGSKYLTNFSNHEDERRLLLEKIPFIPYSLIIPKKELEKLKNKLLKNLSSSATPLIVEENLEKYVFEGVNNISSCGDLVIFGGLPENIHNVDFYEREEENTKNEIEKCLKEADVCNERKNLLSSLNMHIDEFEKKYKDTSFIEKIHNEIINLDYNITKEKKEIDEKKCAIKSLEEEYNRTIEKISLLNNEIKNINDDFVLINKAKQNSDEVSRITVVIDELKKKIINIKEELDHVDISIEKAKQSKEEKEAKKNNLEIIKNNNNNRICSYEEYANDNPFDNNYDLDSLIKQFYEIKNSQSGFVELKNLDDQIQNLNREYQEKEKEHEKLRIELKIDNLNNLLNKNWDSYNEYNEQEIKTKLYKESGRLDETIRSFDKKIDELEKSIKHFMDELEKCNKTYDENVLTCDAKTYVAKIECKKTELEHKKSEADKFSVSIDKYNDFLVDKEDKYTNIIISKDIKFDINDTNYKTEFKLTERERDSLKNKSAIIEHNMNDIKNHLINNFRGNKYVITPCQVLQSKNIIITSENLQRMYDQIEQQRVEIEERRKAIDETKIIVKDMILEDIVSKLYSNLKNLEKINHNKGNIYLDKHNGRQINLIKVVLPEMTFENRVYDYIDETIENLKFQEKCLEEYAKKSLNSYKLLENYINISDIKINLKKKDSCGFTNISYDDFINNRLSGAQKMIISLVLINTLKEFSYFEDIDITESKRNNKEPHCCFLPQDNPFAQVQDEGLIDLFFEIADNSKIQMWNWTNVSLPQIINKHNVIIKIEPKKIEGMNKELLVVKNSSSYNGTLEEINQSDYIEYEYEQLSFNF